MVQTGGSPRRGDPLFRDRQLVQEPIGCHSVNVPVACSRCSRGGGAILFSTGYGVQGIHTQPSASLHTPPVYIDYIIILSYRLCRVVQTGGETLGGKWVDVAISMV